MYQGVERSKAEGVTRYATSGSPASMKDQAAAAIIAINEVKRYYDRGHPPGSAEEIGKYNGAVAKLAEFRSNLVDVIYGAGASRRYDEWAAKARANPGFEATLSSDDQIRYRDIKLAFNPPPS